MVEGRFFNMIISVFQICGLPSFLKNTQGGDSFAFLLIKHEYLVLLIMKSSLFKISMLFSDGSYG